MPQSVGYGEAEILRVGIRPGGLPTERLAPAPESRSSLRPSKPLLAHRTERRLPWHPSAAWTCSSLRRFWPSRCCLLPAPQNAARRKDSVGERLRYGLRGERE